MENEELIRLQSSIDNASHRLAEAHEFRIANKIKEFERSYLETVTWIAHATVWFEKNARDILVEINDTTKITDEYYHLLGVKQIFNSFKHNMKITSLDEFNYDNSLLDIPNQRILWIDSKHFDQKNPIQFESYRTNFENKNVLETLAIAITSVTMLKSTYLFNLKETSNM